MTRVARLSCCLSLMIVALAACDQRPPEATETFYGLDDTIHASARANGEAKVYWTYQDGSSHKEEVKPANGIVTFDFDRSQGMRPGNYTVEIDIDGVPVGITDFVVK